MSDAIRAERQPPGRAVLGRCYAGIGSRATPADVLDLMRSLAARLAVAGWTLRTGGAAGADSAFLAGAEGADGAVELYLPWPGFRGHADATLHEPSAAALALAARRHPAWERCGGAARKLHARNGHQVLGVALNAPCSLVLCWTRDGSLDGTGPGSGGTGQALRIAAAAQVPVFNLRRAGHRRRIESFISPR